MKICSFVLSIATVLSLSSGLANAYPITDESADLKMDYCSYVLSSFLHTRSLENNSSDIREELSRARLIATQKASPFSHEDALSVLFASGLIYQALSEELDSRDYASKSEVKKVLESYAGTERLDELLELTENVWRRVLIKLEPLETEVSVSTMASLERRSRDLKMTPEQFQGLLVALRTERKTQFHSIKLALLSELVSFPDDVAKHTPTRNGLKHIFARVPSLDNVYQAPKLEESAQIEKIMTLKANHLTYLANKKSPEFDSAILKFLRQVKSRSLYFYAQRAAEKMFVTVATLLPQIQSSQTLEDASTLFLEEISAHGWSDELLTKLSTPNSLPVVKSTVDRLLVQRKAATIVAEKIKQLQAFSYYYKEFSYDQTLATELSDIEVHYASSLKDFDTVMYELVGVTRKIKDDSVFLSSLETISRMIALRYGPTSTHMRQHMQRFERALRGIDGALEWYNLPRADLVHKTYFNGTPIDTTPRKYEGDNDGDSWQACFVAKTMIDTPQGPRAIETLREGDEVYSFDETLQKVVIGKVAHPIVHFARPVVAATLADQRELDVTPEHAFYSPATLDYIGLKHLEPKSTSLLIRRDQEVSPLKLHSVIPKTDLVTVFNLEIGIFHNYFANGVLVHNGGKTN